MWEARSAGTISGWSVPEIASPSFLAKRYRSYADLSNAGWRSSVEPVSREGSIDHVTTIANGAE